MPPRTRARVAKDEFLAREELLRSGPLNTTGLPALPPELLLEIISHVPTIDVPIIIQNRHVFPYTYLERAKLLSALSQTCDSLRRVFLPILWQRLEVCAGEEIGRPYRYQTMRYSWDRALAVELVWQLETVTIRDPSLAQFIRIVNIVPTKFSSDTVIPEFARCLTLFPNLHTIQILGRGGDVGINYNAFHGRSYPSVRTVCVPRPASIILTCCPNATSVRLLSPPCAELFKLVLDHCPNLEELYGFSSMCYDAIIGADSFLEAFIKTFPKTRNMVLDTANPSLTPAVVKEFSRFSELHRFEIFSRSRHDLPVPREGQIVQQATAVLNKGGPKAGRKRQVLLKFSDGQKIVAVD